MKSYYTYILTNKTHTVLYTGVTNNLERRMWEHKNQLNKGFTAKYNCHKLVWYEEFSHIDEAISVEKRIKNWKRSWKINLIEERNPDWEDLSIGWNMGDSEINSE